MYGHNLSMVFGSSAVPALFLDKCCINQFDEAEKMEAVRAISAFINNSERMVVCFSSDYFNRLWCAYEMATFLKFNDVEQIDFANLELLGWIFAVSLCHGSATFSF